VSLFQLLNFPISQTSSVNLLALLLKLLSCLRYHVLGLSQSLLELVGVHSFHRFDLMLKHLNLFPHSVVVPVFFDLLIVRLDFLNHASRLLQFQGQLLYQVVLRLDLLHAALANLLPSDLDTIGQPSIVLCQHLNVSFKRTQFLFGKRHLFRCLPFNSFDLFLQLVYLKLVLLHFL